MSRIYSAFRIQLLCCVVGAADNAHISSTVRPQASTETTEHRSTVKDANSDVGVPAQLVISIPVINWASRAHNPRRRTVCITPSAQQFQSVPAHSAAASRHHSRRSKTPWPDQEKPRHRHQHIYNYGRSWYDGLDQLD